MSDLKINFLSPARIQLPCDSVELRSLLTYTDKSIGYQISKLIKNSNWVRFNPESYYKRLAELKNQVKQSLIFQDEHNGLWTYSGFAEALSKRFGWTIINKPEIQVLSSIPWANKPFEMRYYQKEAFEALCAAKHGAIELPTGSGKSLIIANLLKNFPVKTLVITPFTNVTTQLYNEMVKLFGVKYVGMYGDGKKTYKKLFTIATGQSITRIKPGTLEWQELSKCQMFISDESHYIPAETFEKVCMGVAEQAPLRFFISATQTRTDGSKLKLSGITNRVVYDKDFQTLANEGFLKHLKVKIFQVPSFGTNWTDPKQETRQQLYRNPKVNQLAASIAEKAIKLAGRQTVIMIEEYDQFLELKKYLNIPFEFVHGSLDKESKEKIPEQYWKSDPAQVFSDFNAGKLGCLIGTSAMGVGVNLEPVGCLIFLQGGTSEIKQKQSIGRGTRPVAHKDLWVIDFNVLNSPILNKHLETRKRVYQQLTDSVEVMDKVYG